MRARGADWTTWGERSGELARTQVVVLGGGSSAEREVSLTSSRAIAEALGRPGGEQRALPASVCEVEVDPAGRWCVEGVALSPERALERLPADALYFLGLHGGAGEDGRVQAFLEVAGRRYTGAGPAASQLCMDKRRARQAVEAVRVVVAPGRFISREEWAERPDEVLADLHGLGLAPWFVKPNGGGSSVDLVRVAGERDLPGAVEGVLARGDDVLVEAGQDGLEVTAGIVGNRGQEPVLLPIVEILPRQAAFFDYREKYSSAGAREVCPPEQLAPASAERVQDRALCAYRALGCEGYARLDFIVPPAGVSGDAEPVFLEANTLPGFTARSLLPQAAAATGVDFRGLCLELCARALARFEDL